MKKKKRKRVSDYIAIIIMIVAIGVFIYSAYQLYLIFSEYKEGEKEYEALREYVQIKDMDEEPGDGTTSDAQSDSALEDSSVIDANEIPQCPITVDFEALRAVNSDIVGWIYVEAIPKISYPIVQGEDNSYYLTHTVEKTANSSASIFMDYRNTSDFSDPNTVIYGHNMKNQSMFGLLKYFKEAKTFAKSHYVWIVTAKEEICYEIFSVRDVSENDSVYNTLRPDAKTFQTLLESYQKASIYDGSMSFDGTQQIVTLSTCTSNDTVRCIVQAVRKEF